MPSSQQPRSPRPAAAAIPAIPADGTAAPAENGTETVTSPEERGTIEDRREKVRGDSGKWRDQPRLLVTPAPPGGSLDEWADSVEKQADKPTLSSDSDT